MDTISSLGVVNTSPEKFENGVFTFKTHQMFSIHNTLEKNNQFPWLLRRWSIFKMFSVHWHKNAWLAFSNWPFSLRLFSEYRPRDMLQGIVLLSIYQVFENLKARILKSIITCSGMGQPTAQAKTSYSSSLKSFFFPKARFRDRLV